VPWLQIGYAVTFLVIAAAVVGTLVALYSDGVQGKAKASALALAQRLNDIVEFNLKFRDFDGIDKVFSGYRRLNPEISEAALIIDGAIQISTDPNKVGRAWNSDARTYEYSIDLSRPDQPRRVNLAVTVPTAVVYQQVERSVRNFAALFVASAFLAGLFLQVASSMQRLGWAIAESDDPGTQTLSAEAALIIVKPIFFLAVFLEHLLYSFLPKFMQDVATASDMSPAYASAPFTAYYLCFALSLIPAGYFAERRGPRLLIWLGLVLASASVLGLVLPLDIMTITLLRAISGIGQGMLFIGIQSYILAVAPPEKKTQGAAIIVFGFQGGMISGMAIGSLLVNYLQPQGVFMLSGVIGFATALYSMLLIPREVELGAQRPAMYGIGNGLKSVFGSGEFLKTMFCIGVPAKAILTGTITFGLPLLLGQNGYRQEEIGQIIMLYAIGVVVASGYVSRVVDRTGSTKMVLFWGAVTSGFGLVLVGLMGSPFVGNGLLSTAVVIAGVILVGLAHGFINAPVVTHVAHSELAKQIGANSATTAYRFLERIGHVIGPVLVAQLFLIWGQSPQVLAGIGIATAMLGFVFIVQGARPRVEPIRQEAMR
jgi:MFS family permease